MYFSPSDPEKQTSSSTISVFPLRQTAWHGAFEQCEKGKPEDAWARIPVFLCESVKWLCQTNDLWLGASAADELCCSRELDRRPLSLTQLLLLHLTWMYSRGFVDVVSTWSCVTLMLQRLLGRMSAAGDKSWFLFGEIRLHESESDPL